MQSLGAAAEHEGLDRITLECLRQAVVAGKKFTPCMALT